MNIQDHIARGRLAASPGGAVGKFTPPAASTSQSMAVITRRRHSSRLQMGYKPTQNDSDTDMGLFASQQIYLLSASVSGTAFSVERIAPVLFREPMSNCI